MARRQSPEQTDEESRGWLSSWRGRSDERTREESATTTETETRGWFGRARAKYGLGALLVIGGAAMFLFPEPITTSVGAVMIGVGALIWLVSWVRSRE